MDPLNEVTSKEMAATMRAGADALERSATRIAVLERALRPFALALQRLPEWIGDDTDIGRIHYESGESGITVGDLEIALGAVALTLIPEGMREALMKPGPVEQAALDGKLDEPLFPGLFDKEDQ